MAVIQVLVRTSLRGVQCITTRHTVLHHVMYGTLLRVALEPVVSPPPYTMYITSHVTQQGFWVFYGAEAAWMGTRTPALGPLVLCGHFRPLTPPVRLVVN